MFKDTVAIIRGIYRVTEGFTPKSSVNGVRSSSWIDDPTLEQEKKKTS
jgi:hypothetical protein